MMRSTRHVFWILLFLCVTPIIALAQEDCPAIVQAALAATDNVCSTTGRNQACYGNIDLQAVPQPGATLNFSKPGDLVDVNSVQSFVLSPLDLTDKAWGVALMKLQANLPDTLPGQNVTFLLFGNVEIENATQVATGTSAPVQQEQQTSAVTLPATFSAPAPVMESMTDTSKVPTIVNAGTQVTADGRDSTGQMIHVIMADGTSGWTVAQMVTVQGDINTLPEINIMDLVSAGSAQPTVEPVAATPGTTPMQAFYFKTGANDAPCAQAPDSGILIQTPEGAGKITLNMNGVDVQLGSTAYVQAAPGQQDQTELTVNVVEGQGIVTSDGETRVVPAGSRVRVPLQEQDGHLIENGVPSDVEPYDAGDLVSLPVGHLERNITVATPLTAEQIAALSASMDLVGGVWHYSPGSPEITGCPAEMSSALMSGISTSAEDPTLPAGPFDFQTMFTATGGEYPEGAVFSQPEANLHAMDLSLDGGTMHWEVRVTSPTTMEGSWHMNFEGCDVFVPFSLAHAQ